MAESTEYEVASPDEALSLQGAWERQFIDDLVAANRLKGFLITQGIDVSKDVLDGLADLSARFHKEIDRFIFEERERFRDRSWWSRLTKGPLA